MPQNFIRNNIKNLITIFPLVKIQCINEDLILLTKNNDILNTLVILKNHINYQFDILSCISCVDYPDCKNRFLIVYDLLSLRFNFRVRIKTYTHELLPLNSCYSIFLSSLWYESEVWDMFGVFFLNHPKLSKLLTDYGFNGSPLRKDFPLLGFSELRFNWLKKKVIYENLNSAQNYKNLHLFSPWSF